MRQQARALQALQGRLANLEASQRQRPAPDRSRTAGLSRPPQGDSRTADSTASPPGTSEKASPQAQRPEQAQQQPLVAGASPPSRTGPGSGTQRQPIEEGDLTPGPGTTEASPNQQAEREPSPAPLLGLPAFPVLSGNDRVKLTLSGQVNRALLLHGDGSGRVDSYFVDNDTSSTRLRVIGLASLDRETTAGSAIEFDLRSNSSALVSPSKPEQQRRRHAGARTVPDTPGRAGRAERIRHRAAGTRQHVC